MVQHWGGEKMPHCAIENLDIKSEPSEIGEKDVLAECYFFVFIFFLFCKATGHESILDPYFTALSYE